MTLLKYFSHVPPTAEDTGIGEVATREENKEVTEELCSSEADQTKQTRKRKVYNVFSGKQRAQIGKYAVENGAYSHKFLTRIKKNDYTVLPYFLDQMPTFE